MAARDEERGTHRESQADDGEHVGVDAGTLQGFADRLEAATFRVTESYPDEVYLEVALLPKAGVSIKPQIFQIGLKRIGGVHVPWRVSYWLPRGRPELPTNRD